MKIGQKIWIVHDGKFIRKKEGIVVGTKNGYKIKVKFLEGDEEGTEFWTRKHPAIRCGYERYNGKYSSTILGKKYANYSGWIDYDGTPRWFPWYSIVKRKNNLEDNGLYTIPDRKSILNYIRLEKRWAKRDKRNESNLPKKFQTRRRKEYCELSIFNKHIYLKARYNIKSTKNQYLYKAF